MHLKFFLIFFFAFAMAVSARDMCDSASNYRLYETSRKCFRLGNNLLFASLGLVTIAAISTSVSADMPTFFLQYSLYPLIASLPFYITGGVQRSLYNRHLSRCGNFRSTELSEYDGLDELPDDIAANLPHALTYSLAVNFEF